MKMRFNKVLNVQTNIVKTQDEINSMDEQVHRGKNYSSLE